MVPVVPSLAFNIKREILALSQELRKDKNSYMDKIWDENPLKSEVIGHCGGVEKTEWPCRMQKINENNATKTISDLTLKMTHILIE